MRHELAEQQGVVDAGGSGTMAAAPAPAPANVRTHWLTAQAQGSACAL